MPRFMDIHEKLPPGKTLKDVAEAHALDLKVGEKYGVHYLTYWLDEKEGKLFCLCDAPSAEAATNVHREAHGLVADRIFPVSEGS